MSQYKSQYDKLNEKYKQIQQENDDKMIEIQKIQRQIKKINQHEVDDLKTENSVLRTNIEKEKALY